MRTFRKAWVAALGICLGALSCAKEETGGLAFDPSSKQTPVADLAELEIRALGADRFTACPPAGDLGDPWFPKPAPWTAPTVALGDAGAPAIDQDFITRTKNFTPTEQAIEATRREFRSCYRKGRLHGAAQEGRVAIVLRVGPDGRVARVEELAGCELSPESIVCMKEVAAHLTFPPPAGGSDTVVIPSVFTSRNGGRHVAGSFNDAYTARAYVTLEGARPGLHACEEEARSSSRAIHASGTFTLTLDATGRVVRAHVDPWRGEQHTLACAGRELEKLRFAPPPSGRGTVVARLNFNPRQAAR